ncbi:MAG: excinuclease ABC subunit UvrA [Cytophagales bacterium]|nr:excinuclease ABC subunit UvrA [Bernardetiaceae bacterium]MDW8205672.1 excinuclease ABC subunit UvrA [Cytophagales bacterium]
MSAKKNLPAASAGAEQIEIYGAREHNLKNIDLTIPRNKLVVITGISGSGKSSLAFDTIYAEGQRRYMESFSAYARSFIGNMERPDVDKINGLSPVIAIEQKTTSRNPRSTVGTTTEIYDFMRLLFARVAEAYSYVTGRKMVRQTEDQIIEILLNEFNNQKISILAPVVKGRKGYYRELFVQISKMGYNKVRVDGNIVDIVPKMQLDRYKIHDIEIVIDRVVVRETDRYRIVQSLKTALREGKGIVMVLDPNGEKRYYSKYLMDPESGIAYDEPAPNMFSFNSPYGACKTCNGLGVVEKFTRRSIVPDESLSISQGAIAPLGEYRDIWIFRQLESILKKYKQSISTPFYKLPEEVIHIILHGTKEEIPVKSVKYPGQDWYTKFDGIISFLQNQLEYGGENSSEWVKEFMESQTCPTCQGARLKIQSLHFRIADKNIAQLAEMDIRQLAQWFAELPPKLSERQHIIAREILKEISKRIGFLQDVGLEYLTLNRPMRTLSGGESQRIRLATQIGTQLVGVLYILDEPSIGLHQRDNQKLIKALKDLRDLGNTVLVVEHDKEMMLESDYIIDIGPGPGIHGGRVVAAGSPQEFLLQKSITADFLSNRLQIPLPKQRRKGNGKKIVLKGAKGHNLKNVTLTLPLGKMICVTGVSGSGKSSLIHGTLYPILFRHFFRSGKEPLPYEHIEGLENIDKVIEIDQAPIGRTPRSNPATYTGMFTDIRNLFAQLPEAKIRGYKAGRFSFNVKGGRCETCEGAGKKTIVMEFLPDVLINCETCKGKRYNRETLEVRFKGKSIADVLDMTVEQAITFFESQPVILRKVKALHDVGLGYITLGQHATTLSGGEAQRVKLATELAKKDTGNTLYILDEPTTGLHFQDIQHLLDVLNKLVDKGNTVLIIEHNMDIIKVADHLIDLGLEGGEKGGNIIFEGTPEEIIHHPESYTGYFLRTELQD